MTFTEIVWYALTIYSAVATLALLGVLAILIPMGAERQRRRDAAVDRDLAARRAQFDPESSFEAHLESALTGGRISPATVQRFIDRGWLDPR